MKPEQISIRKSVRIGNKAECAEFFGVSLPTIEAWIRKGLPVEQKGSKGVSWVIDLLVAAEWRFAGRSGDDQDPESMEPQDRKAWYDGETKRRDLQIKDRELIPAQDVERVIATAFAAIASDVRAIPDNLERKHGISGEVAEAVESELHLAMDTLASRLAEMAPVEVTE